VRQPEMYYRPAGGASLARVCTARGGAYARSGGGSAPQRETFTIFAFGIDRFSLIYYSRRPSREGGRENTRMRRVATPPSLSPFPPFSAGMGFNSVRCDDTIASNAATRHEETDGRKVLRRGGKNFGRRDSSRRYSGTG